MDVLLGLSNEYAYLKGKGPQALREAPFQHDPWFWCLPERGQDAAAAHRRIVEAWHHANESIEPGVPADQQSPLAKIKSIGEPETVRSYARFGTERAAFRVYARRSYFVPEISDELFRRHDVFTAEHDVPYQQRACVDLAAADRAWVFDTHGRKTKLKILVYDIETTQFSVTKRGRNPVDMIGWSEFELAYEASKDLEKEEFNFNLVDAPPDWSSCEVRQEEAANGGEEAKLLLRFARRVPEYDIISGHNILGFDNKEIYERIDGLLSANARDATLSASERRAFEEFQTKWAGKDRTFSFGQQQDTVNVYPTSLDTYHAARRFYFFLEDFTLKKLAPFLGVHIPGRVYLSPTELKLGDPKTRQYNVHDVQEQLGITMLLLAQALPLAFSTGWTFEELLTGGNVRMWDHMAAIRAARQKKLLPATCRAQSVARTVYQRVGPKPSKEQIWQAARMIKPEDAGKSHLKEFLRVAKYGEEMPDWLELPTVIVNPKALAQRENGAEPGADGEEEEELLSYAIPGGMTIHPQEVGAHMIPWWHVITADVGAMYPTILRARNVGADTVRLARRGETPDDWVWLFKVSDELLHDGRFVTRAPGPEDTFAEPGRGVMVGIKVDARPGVTTLAMKGVMGIAATVKKQLAHAKKEGKASKGEIDRLSMAYASLKANRNAGTHGQMLAVNVSCRGFNLWAGAEITTIGQKILADTMAHLKSKGARIVYGDSVIGSRCVVVRDPHGRVEVLPVERLFQRVEGKAHRWHGKDAVTGNGWQALSLNTWSMARAPEWRPILRIIRHRSEKAVFRVRQTQGETICTEDHSLMVMRNERLERARPEDLEGASLVRVPCPPNRLEAPIDLAEYLEPLARKLEASLGPPRRGGRVSGQIRFGYDDTHIWFTTRSQRRGRLRRFVRPGTPECSALCRLLGAYVAEGSVNWGPRQGASIANSDRTWLESVQADFLQLFEGYQADIVATNRQARREIVLQDGTVSVYQDLTQKVQMTTKLAALFFWALGGKGSEGKRVPMLLFNLPSHHQGEFLQKAVEGDGSWVTDARDTARHRQRHFSYTTKSVELASGMCTLISQMGYDYGIRHDVKKGSHIIFSRESKKPKENTACDPWPYEGDVYDLEVEGTHTFVDAYGSILLHNTDGIYIGCSKSGRNLAHVCEALGVEFQPDEKAWYILPDTAVEAIRECNQSMRKFLQYEAFELEAEHHDAMVFVVHKNYLIFDVKNGQLRMVTKGNNFRGSDKAPIAQKVLEEIMRNALRENVEWDDEEKAREAMKASIKKWTKEFITRFDVSKVDRDDLTLVQIVQPKDSYKELADGKKSIWYKRAAAVEELTGEKLRAPKKYRFVVCKKPLHGIEKPSKTGIKPLDYMWPVDRLKSDDDIDLGWYKDMIEKYVRGAFGFEDLQLHAQKGLDAWM